MQILPKFVLPKLVPLSLSFLPTRTSPRQVAATAWRLQYADHWQGHEAGGRSGDELRLAVAHLRVIASHTLQSVPLFCQDLGQEAAAMAAAFHLPHNAAANWMSSPQALAVATYPGGQLTGWMLHAGYQCSGSTFFTGCTANVS